MSRRSTPRAPSTAAGTSCSTAPGSPRSATGAAPAFDGATRVDASGLLVTPGLVNSHHHLYQWLTRGYATDDTLFGWLTTLYPVWARLDPRAGARRPRRPTWPGWR